MATDDDLDAQIDALIDRIDSDDISAADSEVLREFHERIDPMVPQELGKLRQRKLYRSLILLAEGKGGLADALEDRAATEALKEYIDNEYPNEESNRDMRSILFRFGAVMNDEFDEPPNSIRWLPTTYSNNYDTTPDPREILLWDDDVKPMLKAATNARDRAMVALQFDAGLRGGEFKSLQRRDIQDHELGLQVTVDGKQGRRSILLMKSTESINDWLGDHPNEDPNAPLWCKLGRAESVSDRLIYKQFERMANRADIEKPVTLTNFRKSSAAYLARRNLSQVHIENHHGWVRGSDAAARYIQVFGQDTDREIAKLHGADVDDDEPPLVSSSTCPRCEATVAPERDFCPECQQAVDREAHAVVDRVLDTIDEELIEADSAQRREQLVRAGEAVRQNPGTFDVDELHSLLPSDED